MPESPTPPPRYGPPSRGITGRDVELAADACLRAGERPTIEKIREKIGRGSPNTINPLLDAWWKRLSSRLDAGPAALHRLPESVAHVAEALWMQALDEARRRAEQELNRQARSAASTQEDLEVRSHVLSLREGELESRLKDRERDIEELRLQIRTLQLTARKDQATSDAQVRRLAALKEQLLARHQTPATPQRKPKAPGKAKSREKGKRAAKLLQ
jgi:hypothetical protein